MTLVQLRKSGPLVEAFEESQSHAAEPPRALKALARIVDGDLCHRCGSCVGICPTDVLAVDEEEYPVVKDLPACTDCDLCVKVCPGDEFSVPSIAKQMFGHIPDFGNMHGHYVNAYLSYAGDEDLRQNSTSGGLVTALLLWLLETKKIDGAVVIASDDKELWKGKPIIARTREEILSSTKSKYAIAPTNVVFSEIRKTKGRYAVVGLPCQIHGFHKAARLDKRIRERVVLTIGLFCHAAVEHDALRVVWDTVDRNTQENAAKFISRVGKHPGTPHVELKNGESKPVYFPTADGYRPSSMEVINILYRLYTPQRCLTCYDSTSEFADLAVGDPWMGKPAKHINFKDGYSFALARTEAAEKLLRAAKKAGAVNLAPLRPEVARTANKMMGEEKRWRAFRIIETRRRQGHPIPDYGFEPPRASGLQLLLTEGNILSHIFCFIIKGRDSVLRFMLSPVGYCLLWLNNRKRVFRDWRQDAWASFRRFLTKKDGFKSH